MLVCGCFFCVDAINAQPDIPENGSLGSFLESARSFFPGLNARDRELIGDAESASIHAEREVHKPGSFIVAGILYANFKENEEQMARLVCQELDEERLYEDLDEDLDRDFNKTTAYRIQSRKFKNNFHYAVREECDAEGRVMRYSFGFFNPVAAIGILKPWTRINGFIDSDDNCRFF
jgi:hypothetical protein